MKILDSIQTDSEREFAKYQEQRLREVVGSIDMGFGNVTSDLLHSNPQLKNVVCNTLYRYINELRDMQTAFDTRARLKEEISNEPS